MTDEKILAFLDEIISIADKPKSGMTSQDRLAFIAGRANSIRSCFFVADPKPVLIDPEGYGKVQAVAKARAMGYSWDQIKGMTYKQLQDLEQIGE